MKSEQFCLACDDGTRLQHDKRDLAFVYRDQPLEVVGVSCASSSVDWLASDSLTIVVVEPVSITHTHTHTLWVPNGTYRQNFALTRPKT